MYGISNLRDLVDFGDDEEEADEAAERDREARDAIALMWERIDAQEWEAFLKGESEPF